MIALALFLIFAALVYIGLIIRHVNKTLVLWAVAQGDGKLRVKR